MADDACDGCLGARACWVCCGDGCHRCAGTGRCPLCQEQEVDRPGPLQPPSQVPQAPLAMTTRRVSCSSR